jgi:hypothetical protein
MELAKLEDSTAVEQPTWHACDPASSARVCHSKQEGEESVLPDNPLHHGDLNPIPQREQRHHPLLRPTTVTESCCTRVFLLFWESIGYSCLACAAQTDFSPPIGEESDTSATSTGENTRGPLRTARVLQEKTRASTRQTRRDIRWKTIGSIKRMHRTLDQDLFSVTIDKKALQANPQ